MAFFIVKYDGNRYANSDLCIAALAGGEKAFMKMLANKEITGENIFDQTLYLLDEIQEKKCLDYSPTKQDFDEFFKHLNIVSDKTSKELGYYEPITVNSNIISEVYKYRQVKFFKVSDFKENEKYRMIPKMAAVKICKYLYVAIGAVDIRVENPIVVTVKNIELVKNN